MRKLIAACMTGAVMVATLAAPAHADAVEDFYKKTPLTVIIGYSAGGTFDVFTRTVGRYIGNYLPGKPNVIPQNMTGAGSLVATNYMYNVAPKDGSYIAMVRAPVLEPLTGTDSSHFDATKFTWIGSGMTEFTVCALLGNDKIKTFEDSTKIPFTLAGSGPGSDDDMISKALIKLFGMKAKVVTGYPGGAEMTYAVERGEVDGRCGYSYASIKSTKPEWITQMTYLVALSLERNAELPNVPSIMEFAKTEQQQRILRLIVSGANLGRPFLAPPGVPADRAAALRAAFDKTITDPAFVAEVGKRKEVATLMDAKATQALIDELFSTPKEVLTEAKAIIYDK